jgi:cysteine-rich repeat protein
MVDSDEECDDGNSSNLDFCSNACRVVRVAFVTAGTYDGNFGGLSGADHLCDQLAPAGASGRWRAWLSDGIDSPSTRFESGFTGSYIRADGAPIAESWSDLIDGSLVNPIDRDQDGDAGRLRMSRSTARQ